MLIIVGNTMHITKEQVEAARSGSLVRLSEGGTDLVILRADLLEGQGTSLSTSVQPAFTWKNWFDKLESCRALQDGWNGYTATAPNDRSITNAELFLQVLQLEGVEPTRVAPSAMGGVAVTRQIGKRKVFVEFYNDGRAYSLFSEKSGEMNVVPLVVHSLSFRALVANMRDYLDAECAA